MTQPSYPPSPQEASRTTTEGTNGKKALYLGIFAIILTVVGGFLPYYWAGLGTLLVSEIIAFIALWFGDKASKAKETNAKIGGIVALVALLIPMIMIALINWYFSQTLL